MILESVIYIFVLVLGICIGSFLNCVIYRTELQEEMPENSPERKKVSFLHGNSFCPNCKHKLSWKDLFPIFSWLFLRGKCRYCKTKISIQYPIVELATGILFVLLFNPQNIFLSIFYLIVSGFLIIIFIYDLKHYLIPEAALFPALLISIIYNLIPPYNLQYLVYSLITTFVASGLFFLIFWISKEKAMGFGDVELVILMGVLLGFPNVLVALFLAFFFGAIIGLILLFLQKKGLKSEIPFGPFLIAGTFIAMIWGSQITNWYFNFFLI
jgi:leader peptidase (prepilin peptidase)/N-methyltransferase